MKRLLIAVVAVCLAGSAAASSIDFTFGTNFYTPNVVGQQTEMGTNFTVAWNLDNDISLGVYTETSAVTFGPVWVSAIQLTKGVLKRVKVGLNIGSLRAWNTDTMVDILGRVTILSGSGDNITGELVATAAARFSQAYIMPPDKADGTNVGLGVLIGF